MYKSFSPRLLSAGLVLATSLLLVTGCATTGEGSADGNAESNGSAAPSLQLAREAYIQKDYGLAVRLLEQLARGGDPAAQYALGYMYYYGQGTESDPELALLWIRRSASNGYDKANDALLRFAAKRQQSSIQDGWIEERGSGEAADLLTEPAPASPSAAE